VTRGAIALQIAPVRASIAVIGTDVALVAANVATVAAEIAAVRSDVASIATNIARSLGAHGRLRARDRRRTGSERHRHAKCD
jgi:hypothetical protein